MSSPNTTKAGFFFFPILEVLNTYKKSSKVTLCAMYTSTCALSLSHPLPSLLNQSSSMLLKPNCNLGWIKKLADCERQSGFSYPIKWRGVHLVIYKMVCGQLYHVAKSVGSNRLYPKAWRGSLNDLFQCGYSCTWETRHFIRFYRT